MPSPRPKPTALKLVAGNPGKRKLNKAEPKPARGVPSCPPHLSDVAKVTWGRLGVLLDRMGVVTEADALGLERLCDCYAELMELRAVVAVEGRTYKTGDLIRPNPAVAMLSDADKRFKTYLCEFGLTPSARTKVQTVSNDDGKEDPLKEFFG